MIFVFLIGRNYLILRWGVSKGHTVGQGCGYLRGVRECVSKMGE